MNSAADDAGICSLVVRMDAYAFLGKLSCAYFRNKKMPYCLMDVAARRTKVEKSETQLNIFSPKTSPFKPLHSL